jgi:uncharacterized protein
VKHKNFTLADFKALSSSDDEPGTFEAIVSVFNNVDRAAEVIAPGAFKDSIGQSLPPVIWSHQWLTPPIGVTLSAEETDEGLKVKGRLFTKPEENCPLAQHVYTAMTSKNGDGKPALREWSVGLNVKRESFEDRDGQKVVVLEELDLIEYGPCLKGVNPDTYTVGVKAVEVDGNKFAEAIAEANKSDGPENDSDRTNNDQETLTPDHKRALVAVFLD